MARHRRPPLPARFGRARLSVAPVLRAGAGCIANGSSNTRPVKNLAGREVLILQDDSVSITAILNHQALTLKIVLKQKKKPVVVSTKSVDPQAAIPAVNHPWRSYGKKLNGEDVAVLPD